jgi:hypothetical protein
VSQEKSIAAEMIDPNYNPVIGYVLLDSNDHVLCPKGEAFDPVFHSEQRAMEAAVQYDCQADVHRVGKIWLEGTFGVVLYDDGDLMFDGLTAERFVEAIRVRGMLPDRKATRRIDPKITEPKYSCRILFGDIRYNRNIAASQHNETSGGE